MRKTAGQGLHEMGVCDFCLLPEQWHTDRAEKAKRLYAKFLRSGGIDEANVACVAAAIEWHRLRNDFRPLNRAMSEARLCEAVEAVERIQRGAAIMAAEWAQTDQEPTDPNPHNEEAK